MVGADADVAALAPGLAPGVLHNVVALLACARNIVARGQDAVVELGPAVAEEAQAESDALFARFQAMRMSANAFREVEACSWMMHLAVLTTTTCSMAS